jgi:hypothetical protein
MTVTVGVFLWTRTLRAAAAAVGNDVPTVTVARMSFAVPPSDVSDARGE